MQDSLSPRRLTLPNESSSILTIILLLVLTVKTIIHTAFWFNIYISLSQIQLFDFDIEVKPILEVLVGKTVEQALLEVMEEEELANLRAQQRRFEELRHAELVETQRLEEQERRHREEKQRRMRQQLEVLKKEKETNEKIAARAFAQVS